MYNHQIFYSNNYIENVNQYVPKGLYHPLDGDTNFKYKLSGFLTPNKKNFKEKGTSF